MTRTFFLALVLPKIYVDVARELRTLSHASPCVADILGSRGITEREDRCNGLIATLIGHADRLAVCHLSSDLPSAVMFTLKLF